MNSNFRDGLSSNKDYEFLVPEEIREEPIKKKLYLQHILFSLIILGTCFTSFYNYLLFHSLVELFSIVVAVGTFVIAWNSRRNIDNNFFLIVGISFLFVAFIDIIHTLAYKGMPIFIEYDANLSTQLWIAARYLQALSFLFASFCINKKVNSNIIIIFYSLITTILLISIFTRIFPVCYVEGFGLTPFKIISEYVIIVFFVFSILNLFKFRRQFDKRIFKFMILSIGTIIIAELAFTFYVSVYDLSNFIGHVFKTISFYLLYVAIIEIGLENPFKLLFRKLKISEEKYRIITENANDIISVLDKDFNFEFVNDGQEKMTEYLKEELIGKKAIQFVHPDDVEVVKDLLQKVKEKGEAVGEYRMKKKDNSYIWVNASGKVLYKRNNNNNKYLFIKRDIDAGKHAEQKLEQFVSTVSHELRTPLTVLMMSIEYLKNNKDSISKDVFEKLIDNMSRNSELLKELIENILTLSKIDEKRLKMDWKEFSPVEVIRKILDLMEPRLKDKNLSVDVDVADAIKIYGDINLIDQLFRILIDNAIKYSNTSSRIEIKAFEDRNKCYGSKDIDGIVFKFTDLGIGIRKEDIPNLFDRFFRSEDVREVPGTGLGLSIAKELTLLHNGKIFIKSEYGKGSTFSVFLPKKCE